jgi:hypothetical protein
MLPIPNEVAFALAIARRSPMVEFIVLETALTLICPAVAVDAGPTSSVVEPEESTTPLGNPIFDVPPYVPIWDTFPVNVTLEIVTPGPTMFSTYWVGVRAPLETVI